MSNSLVDLSLEQISSKVESFGDHRVPISHETIIVDFSKGLWPKAADLYKDRLNAIGHDKGIEFSSLELNNYFCYLLKHRIQHATGQKYDKRTKYLVIPTLYALALLQIGKAFDRDLGVELIPQYNGDVISFEQAEQTSVKIQLLENEGVTQVRGLPRSPDGNASFLMLQYAQVLVEGNDDSIMIVNHDKRTHPVYAMLMSFFQSQQLNSVFRARVRYGLIGDYNSMLRSLIND
jgi:hypothetical protein